MTGSASTPERSSRLEWAVVGSLAAAAIVLTIVATRHRPGVTADAVSYLAAARNFADGLGFTDYDGAPLTLWPPGLPAMLGVFEAAGMRGVDAARIVNALSMGTTVVLSFLLLRRHVASQKTVLVGCALVAFAPTLLRTADTVVAEPLFTMLVVAFVLLLESACRSASYALIAAAGIVATAAILVKYIGFALPVAGALLIAFAAGSDTVRRQGVTGIAGRVAWFALWAAIGPVIWGIRNTSLDAPAFGRRISQGLSLVTIARDELEGVGRFFVPDGLPRALAVTGGVVVAAVLVAAIVVVVRDRAARTMVPLLLVALGMLGSAFVSRVGSGSDTSARVLAPVYVLLVVVALWLFDYVRVRAHKASGRRVLDAVAVVTLAGVGAFVIWSVGLAYDHGKAGRGFETPAYENSALTDAVRGLPERVTVYSNDPLRIAYLTDRRPVGFALAPGEPNRIGRDPALPEGLQKLACSRPVQIAWFGDQPDAASLGTVDELGDGVLIELECR